MNKLNKLFTFVAVCVKDYAIDDSHGLYHSMNVLNYAHDIYNSEVVKNNYLKDHEEIIYVSSVLHDMCDNKYVNVDTGLNKINDFLEINNFNNNDIIKEIIQTMSYSTVKKNGFPDLQNYQLAYHIVREADLLSAYDFDRCMIYNINRKNGNVNTAYHEAKELFDKRIFKHNEDKLFITDYSKRKSIELELVALKRINNWSRLLTRL
jgi:HD superfamily phosphodiesterase